MRTVLLLPLFLALITGCVGSHVSQSVKVDSAKPLNSRLVNGVTSALENSPTFAELKLKAKQPMIFIDEEKDGWVWVWLYAKSADFFHRWAILKVETSTGAIMKLGTDEKLEDKWLVEFQPQK